MFCPVSCIRHLSWCPSSPDPQLGMVLWVPRLHLKPQANVFMSACQPVGSTWLCAPLALPWSCQPVDSPWFPRPSGSASVSHCSSSATYFRVSRCTSTFHPFGSTGLLLPFRHPRHPGLPKPLFLLGPASERLQLDVALVCRSLSPAWVSITFDCVSVN